MRSPGHGDFDHAVDQLLVLIEGDPGNISSALLSHVRAGLASSLRAKAFGFSADDIDDIVGTAIVRFVESVFTGRLDRGRSAAAYLTWITRNAAYDLLRRRQRRPEAELTVATAEEEDEDDLATVLRAEASRSALRPAIRAAIDSGDHVVVRVIGSWLDLASTLERGPTTREVAEAAAVSHTTVQRALRRFETLVAKCVPAQDPPT